jgi:hypothetical protein
MIILSSLGNNAIVVLIDHSSMLLVGLDQYLDCFPSWLMAKGRQPSLSQVIDKALESISDGRKLKKARGD